jgi:hypothetical protein
MNGWFADTHFFLALRNPKDESHAKARAANRRLGRRRLVTTAWVLTEVADALASPVNGAGFVQLLHTLKIDPGAVVLPADQAWFEKGIALYEQRPDKEWTLTDCISFVVMQEQGLSEGLTGDHHFEQAGFTALLK